MRKFTVIAVLTIPAGVVLGLSAAQAAARRHTIKTIEVDKKGGFGTYEVLDAVQFKVGETIFTDAEIDKRWAEQVESADETAAKARAKAKAEAEARDLAALKAKAAKLDELEQLLPDLQDKAAKWDEFQEQMDVVRTKCAAFDALPEDVRTAALATKQ